MYYDALLLLILGYTTWRGSARGVTWQVAGIAAILLCFLFAAPLSLAVAPMIKVDPPLNRWIAMLAIYLAFSFGCFAAARTVRSMLETFQFQEYDKHLGGLFGFVKGAILCLILTFFAVALSESAREKILRTNSGRLAGYLLYKLSAIMPRELDGVLAPYFRKIEGELIEIAQEEDQKPDAGNGGFPFDLDPRDDQSARNDETDRDQAAEFDRDPRQDESNGADEPIAESDRDESLIDQAAGAIGDRFRDEVSRIVDGVIGGGEKQPPAEDRPGSHDSQDDRKPRRPVTTARDDAQVERLISEIARAFSSRLVDQEQLQSEIDEMLDGVPATIARQALADWRADLYGTTPDPDPGTDVETSLRNRVVRQLEKARVSMNDLPGSVRDRLRRQR